MPLYYNSATPTPSTKNTITNIAVNYGIRDFLLNKNLLPVYPQISTSLNGSPRIGQPVLDTTVNGNANVTPFGLPLEIEGLHRYEIAIISNQFKNVGQTSASLLNIEDIPTAPGIFGDVNYPQGIDSYPRTANLDIEKFGLIGKTEHTGFRKKLTLTNLYLDVDKQIDMADFISLQPAGFSQQVKGYTDTYGGLNLGGSAGIQAANVIGSVLNGQGLGLAKGGIVTNFDFRSSLAGRILGATGLVNDTKLGLIGGQQLTLALANNAAFNTEQAILGGLNVQDNILALVKGGPLPGFRPNYKITIPSSGLGKVGDYASRILGFTLPKSFLSDAGSIFSSENNSGNIERANSMIKNTGKGQVLALITNINTNLIGSGDFDNPSVTPFRSGYAPGYLNNKGEKAINPFLYSFYDDKTKGTILNFLGHSTDPKNIIPEISYNRSNMISKYGFKTPEETFSGPRGNVGYDNRVISNIGFTWTSSNGAAVNSTTEHDELTIGEETHSKKSLLAKTQKLFNSKGMLNLISVKGEMNKSSSQIEITNGFGISKGSAVIKGDRFTSNGLFDGTKGTADNTYCRSWTTLNRYDQVSKMIRNNGLFENGKVPYRFQTQNSTLSEFGFPKIAPYTSDKNLVVGSQVADPKNYMFSIENLAWSDNWADLPPVEVGMGDLLTGKRGRIMWFPPYNIQLNETSNVSWEANNFIGRGESVYTYNNTERSGNLSFSVVVDHSSYTNSFRDPNGPDDNYVASFMAGCIDPNTKFGDKLTVSEKSEIVKNETTHQQEAVLTPEVPPDSFMIYFPNDSVNLNDILSLGYEDGLSGLTKIDYSVYNSGAGIGSYVGGVTSQTPWNDRYNYGLNGWKSPIEVDGISYSGFTDPAYGQALVTYLENKCKYCIVKISSYASPQGNADANKKLADGRSASVKDYLLKTLGIFGGKVDDPRRFPEPKNVALTSSDCIKGNDSPTDTFGCKVDRRTSIIFEFSNELASEKTIKPQPIIKKNSQRISTKITNRLYDESKYFEELTDKDKFVFDRFREKIKYFHPAFHSTTPEGLNSRLTFLQQCTRQGPTLEAQGANNLAFGRPPVCILRLGDFYNTKIVIDNINIDYEPLVWDLNPEGVGVQPMIANVNMSFKFIGGSTLMGPINKLQNALSFNYYANTHVYDPRADYIAKTDNTGTKVNEKDNTIIVETNKPWSIVNGEVDLQKFNDKNNLKTTSTSSIDAFDIDQIVASDESTTDIVETAPTISNPTLNSITYNETDSTKSNGYWRLKVRLNIKDSTGNLDTDATQLIQDKYNLIITTINGTEWYEINLNDKTEMLKLIEPSNTLTTFLVPIKGENGNTTGVKDKSGKQGFYLTLTKENVNVKQINIKLK